MSHGRSALVDLGRLGSFFNCAHCPYVLREARRPSRVERRLYLAAYGGMRFCGRFKIDVENTGSHPVHLYYSIDLKLEQKSSGEQASDRRHSKPLASRDGGVAAAVASWWRRFTPSVHAALIGAAAALLAALIGAAATMVAALF
jgi:hypothetical protein